MTSPHVYSMTDQLWAIDFEDGTLLHCAKSQFRDDARVEAMITHHDSHGGDPDHTDRMREMIRSVRDHEATL